MEDRAPTDMEQRHVHDVYERIAEHFSHTRFKPWPKVQEFLESLDAHALVADVGCGNGKYFGLGGAYVLGSDRSANLAAIAGTRAVPRRADVLVADNIQLPYRSGVCDAVISIAVVHHFSTAAHRELALRELVRVLRPGGRMLVFVWALEGQKKPVREQDQLVEWNLQRRFVRDGDERRAHGTHRDGHVTFHRFYHLFREGELEALMARIEGVRVVESGFDHQNWYCIAERV